MLKKKLFLLFCFPFILGLFMLSGCGLATPDNSEELLEVGDTLLEVGHTLLVGDSYGGGIVAYIFQSGDPGYVADEQHGLIAATADQSTGIKWWNFYYVETGAIGTAIGTGQANTTVIVTMQGAGGYAAWLCNKLTVGSYNDWFLPSKDELNKLYINKVAIGGFAADFYWSSSENDAYSAWSQYFNSGYQFDYANLYDTYRVRAVRAF